jgi:hypothetical protein
LLGDIAIRLQSGGPVEWTEARDEVVTPGKNRLTFILCRERNMRAGRSDLR